MVIMWGKPSARVFEADKGNHCNSVGRITVFREQNQIWTPIMGSWCIMFFIYNILRHRITK